MAFTIFERMRINGVSVEFVEDKSSIIYEHGMLYPQFDNFGELEDFVKNELRKPTERKSNYKDLFDGRRLLFVTDQIDFVVQIINDRKEEDFDLKGEAVPIRVIFVPSSKGYHYEVHFEDPLEMPARLNDVFYIDVNINNQYKFEKNSFEYDERKHDTPQKDDFISFQEPRGLKIHYVLEEGRSLKELIREKCGSYDTFINSDCPEFISKLIFFLDMNGSCYHFWNRMSKDDIIESYIYNDRIKDGFYNACYIPVSLFMYVAEDAERDEYFKSVMDVMKDVALKAGLKNNSELSKKIFDAMKDCYKARHCINNIEVKDNEASEFTIEDVFTAEKGGIRQRNEFWLFLIACLARGYRLGSIPQFVDWAFSKFIIQLDKKDCLSSTQEKLKGKPYYSIRNQESMLSFIDANVKQEAKRPRAKELANRIFLALWNCSMDE